MVQIVASNPFDDYIPRHPDFCQMARISKRTAELWTTRRYGPPVVLIGGRAHYHREDVREWLDSLRTGKAPRWTRKGRQA